MITKKTAAWALTGALGITALGGVALAQGELASAGDPRPGISVPEVPSDSATTTSAQSAPSARSATTAPTKKATQTKSSSTAAATQSARSAP